MIEDIYHVVRNGREETVLLEEAERAELTTRSSGRFNNRLSRESLDRIQRIVKTARTLEEPLKTSELIEHARAESDRKGSLGALRVLDLQGLVHARSGGRQQLVWHPKKRPHNLVAPKGVQQALYLRLRELLRSGHARWHATDWLLIEAGFDGDLELADYDDEIAIRHRGSLPVNFFLDRGKSARKYVLGALKALYWCECLAWRQHTQQAIEWRWVVPVEEHVRVPPQPKWRGRLDPYLSPDGATARRARLFERRQELQIDYEGARQAWIKKHYPEKAAEYAYRQEKRRREGESRRRAEAAEADSWES